MLLDVQKKIQQIMADNFLFENFKNSYVQLPAIISTHLSAADTLLTLLEFPGSYLELLQRDIKFTIVQTLSTVTF